jgi:hypothetical protein
MLAYPNFPSCLLTSLLNVRGARSTWMGPIRIGPRALVARLNGAPQQSAWLILSVAPQFSSNLGRICSGGGQRMSSFGLPDPVCP